MSKYRQHLAQVVSAGGQADSPPVIPLYPVVKKDLTFIHEGNPSNCEGLVNFEKLRMIAKEVRSFSRLSSSAYVSALGFFFVVASVAASIYTDAKIHNGP